VAQLSDMAPGGRLHCRSEHHPKSVSTDTMLFLAEQNGFFVYGCKLCTEILREPQIHVIGPGKLTMKIYENTRKATQIDRDSQGRITSFR
jgi:hypothetical protein